jgi:ATP-binding cassette subfamily B protein
VAAHDKEPTVTAQLSATRAVEADRLLLQVGSKGGFWIVLLALNALLVAAVETALPAVLGRAIDSVLERSDGGSWLGWLALLVVGLLVGDVIDDAGIGAATARSTAWLRRTSLCHLLSVRVGVADRFAPGDIATRLVSNTAEAGSVGPDVVGGIVALVPAVGATVALFLIDPWLGVTFVAGLPALLFLLWAFAKDASELIKGYLQTQGDIAGRLVRALSGARTIAAAGTSDRETRRVLEPLPDLNRHGIGLWHAQTRITTQDLVLMSLMEIAVLAVAGLQLSRGLITPGELLAASAYVALAATFSSAISTVTELLRNRASVSRVGELLALEPVAYGNADLPTAGGRIELRDVTVRTDRRVLLHHVDLVIPAGALVAVVGRSGAGKSTLAGLIGRLADPDEGEVRLDGVRLPDLDRRTLRDAVAYGFERPALFGETFTDAIAFGVSTPCEAEIAAAAAAAHADEFIRRMPDGYRTKVVDAPMSGGEIQRVGLARAFAHACLVLVLDDVAASLDTVTEHEISKALTGPMSDRTRVLVAHRTSTAARADLVVWLEDGRVRAVGPHAELWRDPAYRALFNPGEAS